MIGPANWLGCSTRSLALKLVRLLLLLAGQSRQKGLEGARQQLKRRKWLLLILLDAVQVVRQTE